MAVEFTPRESPNFDERKLPVTVLVLHYTGMESGQVAIDRLCDPDAKVSAHYVVEENGQIWKLVDEKDRAWHAGVSQWRGITDLNSASIGIEIVNGGHDFGLPEFPKGQINAVIELSKAIMERHAIEHIVGHSDIAPERKQDPGEKFPWAQLAEEGIGSWPEGISDDRRVLFEAGSRDRGMAIIQSGLAHIGFEAHVSGVLDEKTRLIVASLQRRYRPDQIDGQVDVQTLEIIKWLAERSGKNNIA